jgi:hypothetical protein
MTMRTITDEIGDGPIDVTPIRDEKGAAIPGWAVRGCRPPKKRGGEQEAASTFGFRTNCSPRSDGSKLGSTAAVGDPAIGWSCPWIAGGHSGNTIDYPLGRLLSLTTTGTLEVRQRLRAAAEVYEGLSMIDTDLTPLRGTSVCRDDVLRFDQEEWINPVTGNTHYKGARGYRWDHWFNKETGNIRHIGFRQSKPARQKWDGDRALVAKIDAGPLYFKINRALGKYRSSVEDAAVHGLTMGEIGARMGYSEKYAEKIGKECVVAGLNIVAAQTATLH